MQALKSCRFSRRRFLAAGAATAVTAPLLHAQTEAPAAPVAIARCWQYDASVYDAMAGMFDLLGGLGGLVRGKTVGIKINLTGPPEMRLDGAPVEVAQWVHWAVIGILVRQLAEAGAVRIRLMESAGDGIAPLEEYMARAGWDPGYFAWAAPWVKVELENTNHLGSGSSYARFQVPYGGYLFPAFDLNHSYADCDVFVSLTKLKQHVRAGITLSMKNCFGMLPLSVYGTNAGVDEPAETPNLGYRGEVMHMGWRNPSLSAPQEVNPDSPRDTGYRLPRVITDIVAARPVHLAVIDGIETMAGAEGPWTQGIRLVKPGVLIAGLNPVCTDAVAMAVMGLDPMAASNTGVFRGCDNMLEFAESVGIGTRDLSRIDVRGERIQDVVFPFGPLGDPTAI
jgi:uncharacterized protein (DUF362 family)